MSRILAQKMKVDEGISFGEFFSSGRNATISPFLTSKSRRWAKDLSLRISIFSALLLIVAFTVSFFPSLQSLSLLLQVMIYFSVGTPALIDAVREISSFKINIDVLMVLAAFLAIFIGSSIEGCLLLVLFSISSAMENYVSMKAKSTLSRLSQIAPTSAQVLGANGKIVEKSVKDIAINEEILIRAGEVIPLDGVIVKGASSVNVSHLTGEHVPMRVQEGMEVASGAVNVEGSLTVRVTKIGSQSTISRMIQLVYQAHESRPKLQSWFDRFGQKYSIIVISLSLFFALALPLMIPQLSYFSVAGSVYRALAFLVAASPCALIIAVPIAYISSINASARQGVLLKGGASLDALAKVKAVAFDKTGTLTSGELECVCMTDLKGHLIEDQLEILSVARALEQHAIHPIADALVNLANFHKVQSCELEDSRALPGLGIEATAQLRGSKLPVAIGSISYISSKLPEAQAALLSKHDNSQGHLVSAILIGEEVFLLQFVDHLRPDVPNILKRLKKKLGLKTYILSGDNQLSVERIAKNLSVDQYFGALKPADKLRLVEGFSKQEGLAMVGDGMNDAPALARASIGISMGHLGNYMAHQVSEVVLMNNDLSLIENLIFKARKTIQIVKQNVWLASLIIVGVSIPALFGWVPLWLAVICHEGGTVLVGLNSLRLLRNKPALSQ